MYIFTHIYHKSLMIKYVQDNHTRQNHIVQGLIQSLQLWEGFKFLKITKNFGCDIRTHTKNLIRNQFMSCLIKLRSPPKLIRWILSCKKTQRTRYDNLRKVTNECNLPRYLWTVPMNPFTETELIWDVTVIGSYRICRYLRYRGGTLLQTFQVLATFFPKI